jgi:lipoprotein-releasing system ATP-binding protein
MDIARPTAPDAAVLRLSGISRSFDQGGQRLEVLRAVDLVIAAGELVGLVGPSGAGKSTLLHIAGLLERPSGGTLAIAGVPAAGLDDNARTALRRNTIGFVYQSSYLLPEFDAVENIVLPQMIAGAGMRPARERARALLARVGLSDRASHRPGRLSGGEQQRVAIARALANEPALLLADEPTGNLDPPTAAGVFALLREVIAERRLSALIATHNLDLAREMDRVVELRDGRLTPWGQ